MKRKVKGVSVHKVLRNSYAKQKSERLGGYNLDKELSNDNQQVYFHPTKRRILYSVTGTHNLKDIGTDVSLAVGRLKNTKRYHEAKDTLEKSKNKYGVDKATIVGHSLGGTIAGYIGNTQKDRVITLDKGATIGQKVGNGEEAYRIKGDVVSLLNAKDPRMKTLPRTHRNPHSVHNIENNQSLVI